MGYDAEYRHGRAKVYITSPENERRLGRKMTKEEIQEVLDDISEKASAIYRSVLLRKLNKMTKEEIQEVLDDISEKASEIHYSVLLRKLNGDTE